MMKKTFNVTLEGPANAVTTNKDSKLVAVAGRNVFKIFAIDVEEHAFVERVNLRSGKNKLTYSSNDVAWNPVDEGILATGATNGHVVIWDLNRPYQPKTSGVFRDHERTINTVCFHPQDVNLLVSGSQDGTMKLFDLRRSEAVNTFNSSSESVRDLQFSPHSRGHGYQICSVLENGNVQIWDSGRVSCPLQQFTAHNGPVFSVDWHPMESKWLSTGGRDKTIKVWDLENKNSLQYCIQTIASVARVRWRPLQKFQIASSSLVVDFSVSVWDIRRPYIPYATFTEHKDITRGFVWIDQGTLLSAGKDNTLCHHFFDEAIKPMQTANPVAIDISSCCHPGDMVVAYREDIVASMSLSSSMTTTTTGTRSQPQTASPPPPSASARHHGRHRHQQHSAHCDSLLTAAYSSTPASVTGSTVTSSSLPSASSPLLSPPPIPPPSGSQSSQHNHPPALSSSPVAATSSTTGSNIIHSLIINKNRLSSMFSNKNSSSSGNSNNSSRHRHHRQSDELPRECTSTVMYISNIASLSMDWFVEFARSYQLTGRSFDDLCQNNADVAFRLGKIAVCNAWKIVRERYAVPRVPAAATSVAEHPHSRPANRADGSSDDDHSEDQQQVTNDCIQQILSHCFVSSNIIGPLRHVNGNHFASEVECCDSISPSSRIGSDFFDQSDSDDSYVNIHPIEQLHHHQQPITDVQDVEKTANYFFSDGNDWSTCAASLTDASFVMRQETLSTSPADTMIDDLPEEAFMQRHDIADYPNPPQQPLLPQFSSPPKVLTGNHHPQRSAAAGDDCSSHDNGSLSYVIDMLLSVSPSMSRLRPLIQKDDHLIENILKAFASEGDVQSCVSLLIVLGDRMKDVHVDEMTQEKWFTAYIELLYRFQLWSIATQVISLSQIPNVNSLNQTSTNVNLCCGNCGKLNHGTGPFVCKNCNTQTCICCVCNEIVYGLYAWCEGCSHGGHLLHLKEWYDANSSCPTGCGHECEYAAAAVAR